MTAQLTPAEQFAYDVMNFAIAKAENLDLTSYREAFEKLKEAAEEESFLASE